MNQKDFYNNNFERFAVHKSQFNQVDMFGQDLIDALIGNHAGKLILDYGCGSGEIALNHLHKGASFVLGVDVSKEPLSFALKKSIGHKNIEFMSIDDGNYCLDKIVPNDFFDVISSYYVFCTIKDILSIENIVKTFYKKVKCGGSVLMLMPNREKFNGKVCYGFSFIEKKSLQEGDPVTTYLRTNDAELPTMMTKDSLHLELTDYFRSQDMLKNVFVDAGFQVQIHDILIKKGTYKGIIDESDHSPIYVLEAKKIIK